MNKKEMVIFILSREYPPFTIGGISTVTCSLAEGISSLIDGDVAVITNTTGMTDSYEQNNNLHIYRVANEDIYTSYSDLSDSVIKSHHRILKGIKHLIKNVGNPSIILLPDLFCFPEAKVISKIYNCPIINILSQDFRKITPYDKNKFHMVSNSISANHYSLFSLEEKSLRLSDYNIFVSSSLSNSINEKYEISINNQSIVHLGIIPSEMTELTNNEHLEIREKLSSTKDILFVSCGRLVPVKGMNYLIEAFYLLKKKISNVKLIIIGIGPELTYLQGLVNQLNLEEEVKFLGNMPRDDVLKYFKVADIGVIPSIWESFCYVAAELMGIGKPIICSGVDSLNELIRDNIDGIKVPVYIENEKRTLNPIDIFHGMLRLIEEPNSTNKMAENAKKRAQKKFNNDLFIKKIMYICNKLLTENNRGI
ncbi:glycosyltransferase family 4 protein [Xenorhabdus sp. PB62.4]|uniref:glycosyltransferase family 4 protein n=1 Tax=Xenorhabdus sp. PB62.4 TaxID=1851573 RepID=UPI00165730AD|nr:glycosyltransferase family 4 protein [Xenorhabdus sp. PB62.4]MBC8953955.1 glycosyltransferase, group 1 family protein [Xenorhabdus sp. PB62.4]